MTPLWWFLSGFAAGLVLAGVVWWFFLPWLREHEELRQRGGRR